MSAVGLITSVVRKILYYGFCECSSITLSFEHMSLEVAFNEVRCPYNGIFTF